MTCIVGLEHQGHVWMGGDSAGTCSNMNQRIRSDKKVFVRGEFIFGFCGSFRMGQVLKHSLDLPVQKNEQNATSFMVNEFVDSIQECFEKKKIQLEGSFLVGYRGKLYDIQGDYQVGQPEHKFDAAGSGADVAIGSMHTSIALHDPELRIRMALEASALNNAAVRPPFTIMKL